MQKVQRLRSLYTHTVDDKVIKQGIYDIADGPIPEYLLGLVDKKDSGVSVILWQPESQPVKKEEEAKKEAPKQEVKEVTFKSSFDSKKK